MLERFADPRDVIPMPAYDMVPGAQQMFNNGSQAAAMMQQAGWRPPTAPLTPVPLGILPSLGVHTDAIKQIENIRSYMASVRKSDLLNMNLCFYLSFRFLFIAFCV